MINMISKDSDGKDKNKADNKPIKRSGNTAYVRDKKGKGRTLRIKE